VFHWTVTIPNNKIGLVHTQVVNNIVFQHPVALRSHLVYYMFCL
jgi:hypothetical protein